MPLTCLSLNVIIYDGDSDLVQLQVTSGFLITDIALPPHWPLWGNFLPLPSSPSATIPLFHHLYEFSFLPSLLVSCPILPGSCLRQALGTLSNSFLSSVCLLNRAQMAAASASAKNFQARPWLLLAHFTDGKTQLRRKYPCAKSQAGDCRCLSPLASGSPNPGTKDRKGLS